MKAEYLFGVNRMQSSFQGIEIVSVGNDEWYAAEYSLVKSQKFIPVKQQLIATINKAVNRSTRVQDWDWHHVVESEHMEILAGPVNLGHIRDFAMPTILIHKPEHIFFSRNFNNSAFRELAGLKNKQIQNLKMMYDNMYQGYPALRKIAANVFAEFLLR